LEDLLKKSKWKGFKNKLSTQLIKSIFSLYLSFAILVTLIQVFFEIKNIENQIRNELEGVFKSRQKILRKSLYYIDDESIESILSDALEIPSIDGIIISDIHREKIFKHGMVPLKKNERNNKTSYFDGQINYKFEIYAQNSKIVLGKGELLSSRKNVLERLEISLLLILINAFIKTLFIWFVMSKVFIRYLENPLNKFSRQIKNLNYENLKEINIKMEKSNELDFLIKNFNKLIEKINFTKDKTRIYRELLEKRADDNTNLVKAKEKK
jgi:methyl-accepting chemotaxis protein